MNDIYYDDDREMMDMPIDMPVGTIPITFNVPIPTIEQVTGEIARQIIRGPYNNRNELLQKVQERIYDIIDKIITDKATPIIEELLAKPMQPTDGFGNAIGEKTSLYQVLLQHITQWTLTPVDREGKPSYKSVATHIDWALGSIVNRELKAQVDVEVKRISAQLKDAATNSIAKQISERISGMFFK